MTQFSFLVELSNWSKTNKQ